MNHFTTALLLIIVVTSGCNTLPRDEFGRRQLYERRLSRLDFPVTRARLYKTLRPESPARPTGNPGSGLLTGSEYYRLDDIFVVELSVVYKAVAGAADYFNPAPSIGSQVRSILDASRSIENFMSSGTPEHPADIIQRARIVRRPTGRSAQQPTALLLRRIGIAILKDRPPSSQHQRPTQVLAFFCVCVTQ